MIKFDLGILIEGQMEVALLFSHEEALLTGVLCLSSGYKYALVLQCATNSSLYYYVQVLQCSYPYLHGF